jgi:hypothetical protein
MRARSFALVCRLRGGGGAVLGTRAQGMFSKKSRSWSLVEPPTLRCSIAILHILFGTLFPPPNQPKLQFGGHQCEQRTTKSPATGVQLLTIREEESLPLPNPHSSLWHHIALPSNFELE